MIGEATVAGTNKPVQFVVGYCCVKMQIRTFHRRESFLTVQEWIPVRVAVNDGKVVAHVPLPMAGLMSDRSVDVVSDQIQEPKGAWNKLGCALPSPYITLSFTSLSVIPELRITDKGLLDSVNFKFVNPVKEGEEIQTQR